MATTDLGGDVDWGETASAVAVQPDGKVVAAGPVLRKAGDQQTSEWTLVRYRRNGTLDPTFGDGGRVTTRFGGGWDSPNSLVVQPDGKITAAGFAGHIPGGSRSDFGLARYEADGDLDSSFGTGGLVVTDFGVDETVYDMALTSNGRIVVAGTRDDGFGPHRDIALARYGPDGTLDPSFGTGGRVITDFAGGSDTADTVIALPDDRLVVAGATSPTGTTDITFGLARYRPDGTLDPTFGTGGLATTDLSGAVGQITDIVGQRDGRLVASGFVVVDGDQQMAVARYSSTGHLDPAFAGDGLVTIDVGLWGSTAAAVVLQADGKPIVAGSAFAPPGEERGFALARFHRDGRLDRRFGTEGIVISEFGVGGGGALALALQRDGRLLAAGNSTAPDAAHADLAVARLHTR